MKLVYDFKTLTKRKLLVVADELKVSGATSEH
jgi:hypothetical protein